MASSESPSFGEPAIKISPTPPSHGLFSVPNEVLSMIVLECESTDLKNLRLVSKVMHGFSTQLFARKYFSRRRFLLTCITFGTYRLVRNPYLDDDSSLSFSLQRLQQPRRSDTAEQSARIVPTSCHLP
jgi:hypothetical protein